MGTPKEHNIFDQLVPFFQRQFNSIRLCLGNDHLLSACILLFSTVDSLAALHRHQHNADVTREDFKSWCNLYLVNFLKTKCTGEDLYGARCGVLHTSTAESSRSRQQEAKQIYYFAEEHPVNNKIPGIVKKSSIAPDFLTIELYNFLEALEKGTCEFFVDVKGKTDKVKLIEERCQKLLTLGFLAT